MNFKYIFAASALLGVAAGARAELVFGDFNNIPPTCKVVGWTGEPTRGTLTIPHSYTDADGVTYTVRSIADDALNNMPELTEVVIPFTIDEIGAAHGRYATWTFNFTNCPKLERFTVETGNYAFVSTDDGMITSHDGSILVKMPARFNCPSGVYDLPASITKISPDAMDGVSTIRTLRMLDTTDLGQYHCFYSMPNLADIEVVRNENSDEGFRLLSVDGILFNSAGYLLSCPPAHNISSYTIPETVKRLGPWAFSHCESLSEIKFPETDLFVDVYAFTNTGLVSVNVPSNVRMPERGIFANCKSLESCIFEGSNISLMDYFFVGCEKLSQLGFNDGAPKSIYQSAFKRCKSLKSFPFNADTYFYGDSIFADSGLEQVVYEPGELKNWITSYIYRSSDIFNGCADLKVVDFSQLSIGDDVTPLPIAKGMFANCPNLEKVIFPELIYPSFYYQPVNYGHYFSLNPQINTIVVGGASYYAEAPLFCYTASGTYAPDVYWRADKYSDDEYTSSLNKLFYVAPGVNFIPTVYSEVLAPRYNYFISGAKYYVPALATKYYTDVTDAKAEIHEMFNLSAAFKNGTIHITTASNYPGEVEIVSYKAGSKSLDIPGSKLFDTGLDYGSDEALEIAYDVDGYRFTTSYKATDLIPVGMTGLEDITDASSNAAPRYFDLQGREVVNPAKGALYIVRRGADITKEILK